MTKEKFLSLCDTFKWILSVPKNAMIDFCQKIIIVKVCYMSFYSNCLSISRFVVCILSIASEIDRCSLNSGNWWFQRYRISRNHYPFHFVMKAAIITYDRLNTGCIIHFMSIEAYTGGLALRTQI